MSQWRMRKTRRAWNRASSHLVVCSFQHSSLVICHFFVLCPSSFVIRSREKHGRAAISFLCVHRRTPERMTLLLLLLVPLCAALLCLATNSRAWWERLNLAAFALVAGLALKVAGDIAAHGAVSTLNGFLRADALSALVLGL